MIQKELLDAITKAVSVVAPGCSVDISVDVPRDSGHGDFACGAALKLAGDLKKKPIEVAEEIIGHLELPNGIEGVAVAPPGFINFTTDLAYLEKLVARANADGEKFGTGAAMKGQKIMVEFAHPNTHKAFHIGHLRNISLGEALVRLFEAQGAEVFRANYQGDVGMHVAKFMWAYLRDLDGKQPRLKSAQEKAEYLGQVYAKGGRAFEDDPKAQEEIREMNIKIYRKDPEVMAAWKETRQWSLDYFDFIYKRLGTHFDHLYFESEVFESGLMAVEKGLEDGIFERSDGAIVFPGEKYGLHTRVFVSGEGNATYEAKDLGLVQLQVKDFDFDLCLHVVASEQVGYFEVIIKAMEILWPRLVGREKHLAYGMVKLPDGKMSSRTGDVVTAEFLLNEARAAVDKAISNEELTAEEREDIIEKVAVGALKFVMLHASSSQDIVYDLKKAVSFEGDSGPYVQYAYARIQSILRNIGAHGEPNFGLLNVNDWQLARRLLYFEDVLARAAADLSTHHVIQYLLPLAAEFSGWYGKNRVVGEAAGLMFARAKLIAAVGQVLKNGLQVLGIQVPEKM